MSVSLGLLALLAQQPQSASSLKESFGQVFDDIWELNIGQVSQTLSRLERDGLVHPAGTNIGPTGRQSTVYEITNDGAKHLEDWWWDTTIKPESERDELITKIMFANHNGIDVIQVLDAQRNMILKEIRQLNQRNAALPEQRSADRLITERRIFELEATARFLDRVEALQPVSSSTSPSQERLS